LRTRSADRWYEPALGAVVLLGAAGLGLALGGATGAALGAVLGAMGAAALWVRGRRRSALRRQVREAPFPDAWRRFLHDRYEHYERLPDALRRRFEADVRVFLAEKRITGVGVDATDDLKLLVAASAVTLSLCWPEYEWDQLTEVLLYPQDFDRDYEFDDPELAGQAHPWGTVILSVPALEESFEDPWDAFHVGLHEFAHLLGLTQTEFGAVPVGLPAARAEEWMQVVAKERERLRRGKSVIDDYGEESDVEFLAVAVEAFFEIPLALRLRHREVYAILSEYFRQDPAAWDDERGLVL
jgi:Mlc titration factor MtfA (ptsG expression regulator)